MKPFKVIGIGLNKTGTKTLSACLRHFGYERNISVRRDLLELYRDGELEEIFKVVDKNETFEDWPFPLVYKELFFRYGSLARYILTKRKDPISWLNSLKSHSLTTSPDLHCRRLAYGFNYPHGLEKEHLDFYCTHNDRVVEFFNEHNASHLLLEISWDAGDGWDKLCPFLGEPIPTLPFPHLNEAAREIPDEIKKANLLLINQQLTSLRSNTQTLGRGPETPTVT